MSDAAATGFFLDRFTDFLTLEQGTSPRTIEAYQRDVSRLAGATADHVGLLIIDGILSRELVVADHVSAELLGPGDLVRPWQPASRTGLLPVDAVWTVLSPLTVTATFAVAQAILLEAALSFLGLGVRPPQPSWGNMLNEAQSLTILESMPWLWLPPGLAIAITVLAINFIGDGLRDALDPRQRL